MSAPVGEDPWPEQTGYGVEDLSGRLPGHGGNAGLCFEDHTCQPCSTSSGPCVDLFEDPTCGTVACTADEAKGGA